MILHPRPSPVLFFLSTPRNRSTFGDLEKRARRGAEPAVNRFATTFCSFAEASRRTGDR
jgi:hypothetical protein